MKRTVYNYLLPGKPQLLPVYYNKNIVYSNIGSIQKKLTARRTLEYQHDGRPLLVGNILFHIKFYFLIKDYIQQDPEEKYFLQQPDLVRLIDFIHTVSAGVLFSKKFFIVKTDAEKLYSQCPRTEITIIEERKL